MRAVKYDGSAVKLDAKASAPAPGPGEALVRPVRVGVSTADIATSRGATGFRGVMGHEFVGVVEEINGGDDRRRLKGKRVAGSALVVCGKCDMCRAGLSGHCRGRAAIGLFGRDGCFADAFTIPAGNLVEVPAEVDDDRAVFAGPLGAALHTRQMFRVEGKPNITVLGDGRMGLLVAQAMAPLNARVRLLGKHAGKFGLCERWGIKHRHVDEAGRRNDQDVVIDCTGRGSGLRDALGMVRPRGKVVLMSSADPWGAAPGAGVDGVPSLHEGVDLSAVVRNEIEVVGSRCGSIGDALEALRRGEVDVLSLITKRAKLNDAPGAIAGAASGQIKVVMEV